MSGEISIIVTMVAIGVALATFMFAMFRILERRIDRIEDRIRRLEDTVKEVVKDVAEIKGSLRTLHHGLRISVGEPADPD